jgi:hypothetical protein
MVIGATVGSFIHYWRRKKKARAIAYREINAEGECFDEKEPSQRGDAADPASHILPSPSVQYAY